MDGMAREIDGRDGGAQIVTQVDCTPLSHRFPFLPPSFFFFFFLKQGFLTVLELTETWQKLKSALVCGTGWVLIFFFLRFVLFIRVLRLHGFCAPDAYLVPEVVSLHVGTGN